jgi:hypothetical protein
MAPDQAMLTGIEPAFEPLPHFVTLKVSPRPKGFMHLWLRTSPVESSMAQKELFCLLFSEQSTSTTRT